MAEPIVLMAPPELDIVTAPEFRNEVASFFAVGVPHVVLDLAEVRFIDSSGIGALVGLAKRAHALGIDLRLRNVGDNAATTLRFSGAANVLLVES